MFRSVGGMPLCQSGKIKKTKMNTIPNFILRPTFCSIDALRTLSNCACVGLNSIPTTNQLQIKENTISLQFKSPYSKELDKYWASELPEYHLKLESQEYIVPEGTSFFEGSLTVGSPKPMDMKIVLNKIIQPALQDGKKTLLAITTALGMVIGKRYGDHRFLLCSDVPDFSKIEGIGVMRLQETKSCPYRIFDTRRTNVLEMLSRFEYQAYAKEEMTESKESVTWFYDEQPMQDDAFGKLADLCFKNNDMLVATSMLLEGSLLGIEYQKPFYHVVLETITSALMKKDTLHLKPLVDKDFYKHSVLPVLQTALAGIKDLSEESRRILDLRIQNNLNAPANQNKLTYLFEKFGYAVSSSDEEAIKKRNTSFHGHLTDVSMSLREQENELFAVSLRLHKLCCILLLKAAGFSGKILNNEVLFGIKEACERKEHAYINI